MATHEISLLNASLFPSANAQVYTETADVQMGANDVWRYRVWVFASPTSGQAFGLHGSFTLPLNYVGTPVLVIVWNSTATSGNVRTRFSYRAVGGDGAESLDQAGNQESVNGTDTVAGTARYRMTQTYSLTAGNFSPGDTVQWFFERWEDASNLDTMAAAMFVHDILLQYADA
jgi:hypothetical protein